MRVAGADLDVSHQVAVRVQPWAVRAQCRDGVDDRIEDVVLDDDPLRGPPRGLRVVGGDQRDRLALVADHVDREDRLVPVLEAEELVAGHVVVGEDREDPGVARAAVTSTPRIRAYGCGLRRVTPQSMPSIHRSLA